MNQCKDCKYKRNIPGDTHIACTKPDKNMTGNPHGIANGWFIYPIIFDPIWMTKICDNYKKE